MESKGIKSTVRINETADFKKFKMSFLVMLLLLLVFSVTLNATEYVVDKAASKVNWVAKKVTGQHSGSIWFANLVKIPQKRAQILLLLIRSLIQVFQMGNN